MAEAGPKMEDVRLEGKTVLVTGANTGIGKETARELAKRGARVILACRNQEKGDAARTEIVEETKNEDVVVKILDLGSLKSIRDFADDINANEARLDILVNNAGLSTKSRKETEDGFEMMFGVNHLGTFHLTNLLLDKIKANGELGGRIVILSSVAHKWFKLDFKDLQSRRSFGGLKTYSRSKGANVLHAVHLAKLLEETKVSVYIVHPGNVASELSRDHNPKSFKMKLFQGVAKVAGQKQVDVIEGAKTSLYCCLEPSIAEHSGRYYAKSKESTAKSSTTNAETAKKFWDISVELIANPPGVSNVAVEKDVDTPNDVTPAAAAATTAAAAPTTNEDDAAKADAADDATPAADKPADEATPAADKPADEATPAADTKADDATPSENKTAEESSPPAAADKTEDSAHAAETPAEETSSPAAEENTEKEEAPAAQGASDDAAATEDKTETEESSPAAKNVDDASESKNEAVEAPAKAPEQSETADEAATTPAAASTETTAETTK